MGKKQEDLRLANLQQTINKVAYIILDTANFLLAQKQLDNKPVNEQTSKSVEALALLGHLTNNVSTIRRNTLKPLLKQEFQNLCATHTEIPHGPLLFGEDITKQLKQAEDSNKVFKAFKGTKAKEQKTRQFPSGATNYRNTYQREFLSRGHSQFPGRRQFSQYRRPYNSNQRSEKK